MQRALAKALPFAVLLCAAAYLFTRTLQFDYPRAPGRLGPDVWPQAILILLMLSCGIAITRALLLQDRDQPSEVGAERAGQPIETEPEGPSRYGLVAGGIALFLVYPVVLEYLGFLVATFLLMALFMLVGQWRNIPGVVAVSAVGTLVLFYVFRGVVYVSLPLGSGVFHDVTVWVAALLGMR